MEGVGDQLEFLTKKEHTYDETWERKQTQDPLLKPLIFEQ